MTNRLAVALAAVLLAAVIVDSVFFDGAGTLFLARKLLVLIDWLAFWH